VDLTHSYADVFPPGLLPRYQWLETREAAAVFKASNPEEFEDLVRVLRRFALYDSDLLVPGGNRGAVSIRLDSAFEKLGRRAVRINMKATLVGKAKKSSLTRGAYLDEFLNSEVSNNGYEVDNMKRRAVTVSCAGRAPVRADFCDCVADLRRLPRTLSSTPYAIAHDPLNVSLAISRRPAR
jgi:hypothetical protein